MSPLKKLEDLFENETCQKIGAITCAICGIIILVLTAIFAQESGIDDVRPILIAQNVLFGLGLFMLSVGYLIKKLRSDFVPEGWYCTAACCGGVSPNVGLASLVAGSGVKTHSVLGIMGIMSLSVFASIVGFTILYGIFKCFCSFQGPKRPLYPTMEVIV